jgi:murein DD-endopeptidase MepM/ murein hydrolase activator NlpD
VNQETWPLRGHPRKSISKAQFRVGVVLAALLILICLAAPVAAQEPAADPTAAPTAEAPVYVVVPGDTLYGIAERFGTTVEAIVAANDIADARLISVGQKLVIPTQPPGLAPSSKAETDSRVHPVRPGETLPFLAYRYGTTYWTLREANDLHRLGLLWPGQEITIPASTVSHGGVPGFPEVATSPAPIVQGQTMLVEVQGKNGLDLNGSFLGQDLLFVEEDGWYWAVAGVDALTAPGSYPLMLQATELDSGDLLTMRQTLTVAVGNYTAYNVVVPSDRTNLLDPALAQAEREKVDAVFAEVSEPRLWDGVFGLPLAGELRTTAPFGQRRSYGGGPVTSYHTGQDFGADAGTPILAPITATVALAEPLQVRGNVVILDHGLGVYTGFWHLSRIDVTAGQTVGEGEVVGLVGNTGLSTGPHLHWEMRVLGMPVDPVQWTQQPFPRPILTFQAPLSDTEPVDPGYR